MNIEYLQNYTLLLKLAQLERNWYRRYLLIDSVFSSITSWKEAPFVIARDKLIFILDSSSHLVEKKGLGTQCFSSLIPKQPLVFPRSNVSRIWLRASC